MTLLEKLFYKAIGGATSKIQMAQDPIPPSSKISSQFMLSPPLSDLA